MTDLNEFAIDIQDLVDVSSNTYCPAWTLQNYFMNGKTPLTFTNPFDEVHFRPWQLPILEAHTANGDGKTYTIVKGRQVGYSEVGTILLLYELVNSPTPKIVLFTFPTYHQLMMFIKSRIQPIINANPYIKSQIVRESLDNIEFKNGCFLIAKSSSSNTIVEGVASSSAYMDEANLIDINALASIEQGLSGHKLEETKKVLWSTPTLEDIGISKYFKRSNQNHWVVKCQACGKWQIMSLDNIVCIDPSKVNEELGIVHKGAYDFQCIRCHKHIDRRIGQYVPKFPSRTDDLGYKISQLDSILKSPDKIMKDKFQMTTQFFYNYVLGEPFCYEGLKITEYDIQQAQTLDKVTANQIARYSSITVGIDWNTLNVATVLGKDRLTQQYHVIALLKAEDNPNEPLKAVKELAEQIKPFRPSLIVADVGYGADRLPLLRKIFPNKTYGCRFTTNKKTPKTTDTWNESSAEVTVEKIRWIMEFVTHIKGNKIQYPKNDSNMETYIKHCLNMRIGETTVSEEDDTICKMYSRAGHDDFPISTIYAMIGQEKLSVAVKTNIYFDFF